LPHTPIKHNNNKDMCGITFLYKALQASSPVTTPVDYEKLIEEFSSRIRHRGPDDHKVYALPQQGVYMAQERLSIIDLTYGQQPLFNEDKSICVITNGEIYNYKELRQQLIDKGHQLSTHSDAETVVHLYEEYGPAKCVSMLSGIFAFVLYDSNTDTLFAARDCIGVKPMYFGRNSTDGTVWFASEMKVLKDYCDSIQLFPPGHYYVHKSVNSDNSTPIGEFVRYYEPEWFNTSVYNSEDVDYGHLRRTLEHVVEKQLVADVPVGVLLSGGLDSSLISGIVRKLVNKNIIVHSFSVGIGEVESSDILAARKVAKHIGTTHHERIFSIEEGLGAIEKVIYHVESYDITTIRATTAMYMVAELASKFVKVVLSGEGPDEIFGGYAYFADAESPELLQEELVKKVRNLHLADVLRCDRATSAHGLEARVPFLDEEFLKVAMAINPRQKLHSYVDDDKHPPIEKYVLRKAFDGLNLIPDEILWRIKVQFSDGVGDGWIDTLKTHFNELITDQQLEEAETRFPHNTPKTKEAYYYRQLFEKQFPHKDCIQTVSKWLPWSKFDVDPSGRYQRIYTGHHQEVIN
jgi:asparagine synthase (glutamine-hydrolysing)